METHHNRTPIYLVTLAIILLIPLILVSYKLYQGEKNNEENRQVEIAKSLETNRKNIVLVASADNTNAFELLKSKHQVEFDQYDFGVFIKSIDKLEANKDNYWAFYLNGKYAETAVDKTILKSGDKIKFVYEKIEAFDLQ